MLHAELLRHKKNAYMNNNNQKKKKKETRNKH